MHYIPHLLLTLYTLLFAILAIEPYNREVWFAEVLPVMIVVILLVATYHKFRFSNFAYFFMWLFICVHTIGAHYTFELVPFEWGNQFLSQLGLTELFPEGRNNFDRISHFLVGVFAYPIVELSLRLAWVNKKAIAFFFALFALGFWAALYEIIEMAYAILSNPEAGSAFLGSQGDPWDAQRDMLMDILGALLFGLLALLPTYKRT
jgi:putative membrane protein